MTDRDLLRPVVSKTLEATIEKTVKHIGGRVLRRTLSVAIAGGVADILAAAAGSLVTELLKKTSAQETKINALVEEPLDSATSTLREVISARIRTVREHEVCQQRLRNAVENLNKAHSLAGKVNPERRSLIRAYQALACALAEGNEPFMRRHIAELERIAEDAQNHTKALRDDADAMAGIRPYTRLERGGAIDLPKSAIRGERRKAELYEEAAQTQAFASNVNLLCEFVKSVAANRTGILESSPGLSDPDRPGNA